MSRAENDNNEKENTIKVNDYLTLHSDGHFEVKLLKERPGLNKESRNEMIERRKAEIDHLDGLLKIGKNPDIYAEMLSDATVDVIEKFVEKAGSYAAVANEYRLRYNAALSHLVEKEAEEVAIGKLINLKGAIRYAEQQGNIARGDKYFARFVTDDGGSIEQVGGNNNQGAGTRAEEQLNTPQAQSRSNQSGFSYAQNRKGNYNGQRPTVSIIRNYDNNHKRGGKTPESVCPLIFYPIKIFRRSTALSRGQFLFNVALRSSAARFAAKFPSIVTVSRRSPSSIFNMTFPFSLLTVILGSISPPPLRVPLPYF